jgi:uncharacterized protein YjeT (DUF2065 family)
MRDFATAIALILVIEGILYALLPEAMKRLAVRATAATAQSLRIAGLVAACLGLVLVWTLRH